MEFDNYGVRPSKRQLNSKEDNQRPRKKAIVEIDDSSEKVYKFRVLLPSGLCTGVRIRDLEFMEMPVKEFVEIVRQEHQRMMRQTEHMNQKPKRRVNWNSQELHFIDVNDNVIHNMINFRRFTPNKDHILRLNDGSTEADTYENMWDLTPDTELLMELPDEYTFETALADLIDNSLQAVWSNSVKERRLVSVELSDEKISIFDTGPGMDGSDENCIVKWGKMGTSLNRSSRGDGVGGKPPYLTPVFGMFGYGGAKASMHLGRRTLVSSKTKASTKVYTLHFQREALLSRSGSEKTWRTDGGIREPTHDEIEESPHGSFTKVEIFEPEMKGVDLGRLQCRLKDIYFPYIQCDELLKKGTITPIEFEVNGINLAEIEGGEVAITNLQSCNGPNFICQLHFSQDGPATSSQAARSSQKANARLNFVYFPIVKGKERIETILEKLKEGGKINEGFDSFSRVSIRRLGRLLPDARWHLLPFMKPKLQRGDKAHMLKRCCLRVKCFIDTDAGFNPTPSKTDLAHHHLYTTALKNFGDKPLDKGTDVNINIRKDGKEITIAQLEKQYQEWVLYMHNEYDKEAEGGEDEPILVLGPSNTKKLAVSSEVLRVHKSMPRRGASWKSGQKIKLLKGAGPGVYKNNIHATLEYILLEGFEGDSGGDARLICRPLTVPEEKGCKLTLEDDGSTKIDIGDSLSLPISVIDHDQCLAVSDADWEKQVERRCMKQASAIEILSSSDCRELGIDGALPSNSTIYAGHAPPKEVVAVVRPVSFHSGSSSKSLDQKCIVRDDFEIGLQLIYSGFCKNKEEDHLYTGYTRQSIRKGISGLYIFPVGSKCPDMFKKAGMYTFSLSLRGPRFGSVERKIKVEALSEVKSWDILSEGRSSSFIARVGSCFPSMFIACYDAYKNCIPSPSISQIKIEVRSGKRLLAVIRDTKLDMSSDKFKLIVKDMLVESHDLDCIRPSYNCTLVVSSGDEELSASVPCKVLPGDFQHLNVHPKNLDKKLVPGHVIDELIFEMFDRYGNHAREGSEVSLNVDGLCLVDYIGLVRKVDEHGRVDLSGLLKTTAGYGNKVSLSVIFGEKLIFKKDFVTEERKLRIASVVHQSYIAGSRLENMVFEIVTPQGNIDEFFHDDDTCAHTLAIESDALDVDDSVKYSFRHGCCKVRVMSLPQNEGMVRFVAYHSRYPELRVTFEVNVLKAPCLEPEIDEFQQSYGHNLLENSPVFKTPKLDNEVPCSQFSGESPLLLQDSPMLKKHVQDLVVSHLSKIKRLEENIAKYAMRIGLLEDDLEDLNDRCSALEREISLLQDSLGPISIDDSGFEHGKRQTMELIKEKEDTAASLICKIMRGDVSEKAQENFKSNILGVVALLGTVQSYPLSRILAEYLGEDRMLALVCSSYASIEMLEQYDENGDVDHSHALHALAAKSGVAITGRYRVLSLKDIRPYTGVVCDDLERKLELPDPTLPDGKIPPGFIGHAVNLINIDADYLDLRTESGYGLRETLFYRLFGELQVYETRACMFMAKNCIRSGAVSLDGGIMEDGILSLGDRQAQVHFPVFPETCLSPYNIEIVSEIDIKKLELRRMRTEIENKADFLEKLKEKYAKKMKSHQKFLEDKGESLEKLGPHLSFDENSPFL